ncbi:PF09848 family protein [Streptococcus oralis SK304]|uniref:PF09848 family protein n=1 Tax=Streptococcus oralis SK304 TaxID=1161421 RepID=J4TES2_STROR|nr:DNA/RNA helicase domain-containing protein [Streptococcus oralis]EJP21084.1 PF09848 family protein [Streptococcus oralis SK304]
MTNTENNKFPRWGKYPKNNPKFNYVRAKLDDTIIPKISDEDFRALSDFPLIYIYISPIQSDGRRYYYIGQTIDASRRTKEHSEKLKKENYERFKEFINGEYIAFYGENISQNLNYIEKILILTFIEEFNFLNFVNMNKDGDYVGKLLANKDIGNESGKYQALREIVEKDVINNILKFLQENKLIDDKPNLKRVTSSLFAESPFFELTENQNSILKMILEQSDKRVHFIKGGAGTGKTVLLLHLIARLKLEKPNSQIAIFVRNTHRDRFKKILTSYGLKPNKNNIDIVTFNKLKNTNKKFDYIFIDEAQRTTRLTENLIYPTGAKHDTDILKNINGISNNIEDFSKEEFDKLPYPAVLDYIKKKFDDSQLIISYDNTQCLRKGDNKYVEETFKDLQNVVNNTPELEPQLRILKGSDSKFANKFITFIKDLLGIESQKDLDNRFISKYKDLGEKGYFKIARNIEEWVDYLSNQQSKFPEKKSLRLAGYCKPAKKANDYEFIKIHTKEYSLKWSRDGDKFRNYANKSTEVGNVYDIHGFDIDFASIYIGKDIYLDEKEKCIKVDKDNSFDTATKKGVDQIDEFVKNAYYILLTRAVYGQMVYIEDDKLREFLLKIFPTDKN